MAIGLTRRSALKTAAAATAAVLGGNSLAAASTRNLPNIIFIMADDLGFADLGCTGSRHISTPWIDSLAENGILFRNGYSNSPVCSATRTALLTGCYQYRFEVGLEEPLSQVSPPGLGIPYDRVTIAELFRDLGYQTSLIGKWHLGDRPEHFPTAHGYQDFFGIVAGGADYFRHGSVVGGRDIGVGLMQGNTEIERAGYLTDLFGDEAVRQIRQKDRPLFLSLHFTAPHWPWEGREDEEVARQLQHFLHADGGSLQTYANMVSAMDDNVGRVLSALQEMGELENSIIVFTSDNGGERFSDTWPFIGMKGELLEGGIRVPIIIQWPDRITAGRTSEQIMTSMDFLPTLISAIGGSYQQGSYDGANLVEHILNDAPASDRALFWRYQDPDQRAVRKGKWKYLKIKDNEFLFDLEADERERANLAMRNGEKFTELRAMWNAWNEGMLPYPAMTVEEIEATQTYGGGSLYADRY